jgi:hypothetical protein
MGLGGVAQVLMSSLWPGDCCDRGYCSSLRQGCGGRPWDWLWLRTGYRFAAPRSFTSVHSSWRGSKSCLRIGFMHFRELA